MDHKEPPAKKMRVDSYEERKQLREQKTQENTELVNKIDAVLNERDTNQQLVMFDDLAIELVPKVVLPPRSGNLFTIIADIMGKIAFMIHRLPCLEIIPFTIHIKKHEIVSYTPPTDVMVYAYGERATKPPQQDVNFVFRRFQGGQTIDLVSHLSFNPGTTEIDKGAVGNILDRQMEHTIDMGQLQIHLYKLFFNAIKKYHLTPNGHIDTSSFLLDPTNTESLDLLQDLFVNIQEIIRNFCVGIAGNKVAAFGSLYPATYAEYMTRSDHYLQLFKMVFVIAKELLDSYPNKVSKINTMTFFLSRSIFIGLSVGGVNQIVDFIVKLHRAGVAINRSPGDIRIRILKFLVPIVESMRKSVINSTGLTFAILFDDRGDSTYTWLQQLLLQQVFINTDELRQVWKEYNEYKRSERQRRSERATQAGGSNKKKRSSKKSKKSKKSGRNKQVRANKKSRRNKKYKNT